MLRDVSRDAEFRRNERGREFCAQFFHRIGRRTETLLRVAIQSGRVAGPVGKFMQGGGGYGWNGSAYGGQAGSARPRDFETAQPRH